MRKGVTKSKTKARAPSIAKPTRRLLLLFLVAPIICLNAEEPQNEPMTLAATQSPSPTAPAETQDATVEPSPIPSTIYVPPPLPVEPELPTNASEPVVTINDQPVNENVRRFRYHFSVTVRTVYDDNINLAKTQPEGDFYTSFEPTIRLSLGEPGSESNNVVLFVYAPNAVFFADHSEADAIQHVIHLEAQRVFGKISASLSGDVQILDGADLRSLTDTTGRQANIDVGARTRSNVYSAKLGASYDLSSKTFLSGGIDYSRHDYDSLISSQSLSGNLYFNYNYSPKLVLGLGGTFGYNETGDSTPAQYFEQANLRASFNPGEKLSLSGSVGVEIREFENADGVYTSPVFEFSASYRPFDGTNVSLTGSRRTQNSAVIAGGDYASTRIDFSVQQRFLQRIFVSLSAGYESAEYFSSFSGVDLNRSDDYYYLQVAIDTNITRFWDVGLYFLHREDSSSSDLFSFSDNQFGIRSSLMF